MKTIFGVVRYQVFVSSVILGVIFLAMAICDFSLITQPWRSNEGDSWVQLHPQFHYFHGRGYFLFGGAAFGFWVAALMFLLPGELFAGKEIPPGILLHYFRRENIRWSARSSLGVIKSW